MLPRKRKSKSDRPRMDMILEGKRVNVCALCQNPKKLKPYCKSNDSGSNSQTVMVQRTAAESSPEPAAAIDIPTIPAVEQPLAGKINQVLKIEWIKRLKTLPQLSNFTLKAGEKLDRNIWPSWKFTTTDPTLSNRLVLPDAAEYFVGGVDVSINIKIPYILVLGLCILSTYIFWTYYARCKNQMHSMLV